VRSRLDNDVIAMCQAGRLSTLELHQDDKADYDIPARSFMTIVLDSPPTVRSVKAAIQFLT
jgi:hypothetical protein